MESSVTLEGLVDCLSRIGLDEASKTCERHQKWKAKGKTASVFVLISSDLWVLFTLRSKKLKSHPGQVSFPGGKQDPEDQGDDVFTALRETHEEVGLDYRSVWKKDDSSTFEKDLRILCRMPTTEALGSLCVTPVVAVHLQKTWREIQEDLSANPDEVETVFWVPLFFFANDVNLRECYDVPDWPVPGENFVYRRYDYEFPSTHQIFSITGLTADIVHNLVEKVCPKREKLILSAETDRKPQLRGYLKRFISRSADNGQWKEFFFVLGGDASGGILHQYDSAEQALRKEQSANKKNRLKLIPNTSNDKSYTAVQSLSSEDHAFSVSILGGRVRWELAALSAEAKGLWMERIQTIAAGSADDNAHANPI